MSSGDSLLQKIIEERLAQFHDAHLKLTWREARVVTSVTEQAGKICISATLGYPFESEKETLLSLLRTWLLPVANDVPLEFHLTSKIAAHVGKQGVTGLPHIKNMIAVASGKGGVGKSTISVNLALALALDADIYGPSQPAMTGSLNQRAAVKDKRLQPFITHGIESISMGHLVAANTALSWRGPMLGKALEQLLHDTEWSALDYLVVDLPPGTGDVQLTLCQKMPVTGAVIVTTPQDVALHDVRRACDMFNKLSVPILGVIENMSFYQCVNCGHESHLFGQGGGTQLAKEFNLELLGQIPLDTRIREQTDHGQPTVAAEPQSTLTHLFLEIAKQVAGRVALLPKDYSAKFPKVVVTSDEVGVNS